ncbi:MAG: heme NO-binding domain-containing protein [Myxococcales bacterium]|nr:heme NO-binding domain-containing protein [Myxococcales bacterium]
MYGLVNRAIEQMVCQGHGEEVWEDIKNAAGVEEQMFISSDSYDDAITYRLVGSASAILGVHASEILEKFGRHWILKTAKEGYGELLRAAGDDVGSFLRNLPNFHTRVKLLYPHLTPPVFVCEDLSESSLRLHYHSTRAGLAPFVRGLLLGIGELFATPVVIEQTGTRDQGLDHDVFTVSWTRAA